MISENTISYMFFMIGAANLLNLIAVWRVGDILLP